MQDEQQCSQEVINFLRGALPSSISSSQAAKLLAVGTSLQLTVLLTELVGVARQSRGSAHEELPA